MDIEKWSLRISAIAIACAILLRLGTGGWFETIVRSLSSPEAVSVMLFLETGRVVRLSTPETPSPTVPIENTLPPDTQSEESAALPVFAQEDARLVEVNSVCGYDADLQELLQKPLSWNLKQTDPTVLILHSHGTESYTKTEDYTESNYNIQLHFL